MLVKLRHCYVKVTSSYHVQSQRNQELLLALVLKYENAAIFNDDQKIQSSCGDGIGQYS